MKVVPLTWPDNPKDNDKYWDKDKDRDNEKDSNKDKDNDNEKAVAGWLLWRWYL